MLQHVKIRMKFWLLTIFLALCLAALLLIAKFAMTTTSIGSPTYTAIIQGKDVTA
jgi:hypothetical protein